MRKLIVCFFNLFIVFLIAKRLKISKLLVTLPKTCFLIMRKFFIAIVMLIFSSSSLFAQNGDGFGFGAKAGLNLADFTGSTGAARVGFVGGAFIDYNIKRFGFELGVYYSQQGSDGVLLDGFNRYNYQLDYLNAQLLVKYQLFNGFRVFIGPQLGYLINSTRKANGITEQYDNINKMDLGINAGVGYTFRFGLDLSASYTRGLTNLFITDRTAYNSTFRVSVGWIF